MRFVSHKNKIVINFSYLQVRPGTVFSGDQVDGMDDRVLINVVEEATVFYRVSPRHKLRIVKVRSSFHLFSF